jgi:glycosyltransferase involved in cell wall biosynthesis
VGQRDAHRSRLDSARRTLAALRVLVVTNMYPPHHLGGYELSCRDTVDRFAERGHEVTVLTSSLHFDGVDEVDEPHVHRELEIYWKDHEILRPSVQDSLEIERHNQRTLVAELERTRPDVVSFWNMGALSMGLIATVVERDIPSVLVLVDDWLVYGPLVDGWAHRFQSWRRPLGPIVSRLTGVPTSVADLGQVDAACFVSETTRRTALDNTPWSFGHDVVTGTGVDRSDFPPPGPEEDAGPWEGRLLFVGRVEVRKGIETLFRALPLLDGTTLSVVGPVDDRYRATLDRLVAELGIADLVTFDVAPRDALRDRYLAADAVIFPSEWEEPFGIVPLEAMACGRPVIATGTGGSGEFLRDRGNCLLHPPGDHDALAGAVRRLADDPDLRATLVRGGIDTAATLTTDRLADVLEEWHLAAASRFVDGEPPARPLVR